MFQSVALRREPTSDPSVVALAAPRIVVQCHRPEEGQVLRLEQCRKNSQTVRGKVDSGQSNESSPGVVRNAWDDRTADVQRFGVAEVVAVVNAVDVRSCELQDVLGLVRRRDRSVRQLCRQSRYILADDNVCKLGRLFDALAAAWTRRRRYVADKLVQRHRSYLNRNNSFGYKRPEKAYLFNTYNIKLHICCKSIRTWQNKDPTFAEHENSREFVEIGWCKCHVTMDDFDRLNVSRVKL